MFVAALKAVCLLLNLRDTFKALKKPIRRQPVAILDEFVLDDDGHARVTKAMTRISATRRERLRENLMIWVVWYAWLYTERILDWSIGWILPLYTQLKLLVLLYLILTRSFGASGIYIHLLKPIFDIYSSPIDLSLLLLSHTLDLISVVIFRAPLDLIHSLIALVRSKPSEADKRDAQEVLQTISDGQSAVGQKAKELCDLRKTGVVRQRARLLEKSAVVATPMAPGAFRVYPDVPVAAPTLPSAKPLPKFPSLPPTLYDFNKEMDKRQPTASTSVAPSPPVPKLVLKPKPSSARKTVSASACRVQAPAAPIKPTRKRKAVEDPKVDSGPPSPVVKKRTVSRSAAAQTSLATPTKKRKLIDGDAEYIDQSEPSALPKRTPRRKAAVAAAEAMATPKPKSRAKRKPRV